MGALTVAATVLAGTAHAVVSGADPRLLAGSLGPAGVSVLLLESLLAVVALGWARRPPWLVATVLTVVQLAQHSALAEASPAGHSGHSGHSGLQGHHGSMSLMLAAHLVAAVLTAGLLGYGESVVRLLLTWLRWLAPRYPWSRLPVVSRAGMRPRTRPTPMVPRLLVGAHGVRGPPARLAFR